MTDERCPTCRSLRQQVRRLRQRIKLLEQRMVRYGMVKRPPQYEDVDVRSDAL